jgi:hypothetical protein
MEVVNPGLVALHEYKRESVRVIPVLGVLNETAKDSKLAEEMLVAFEQRVVDLMNRHNEC